ncbi:MAG: ABC transporter permease [Pirellulales bacterium]|nr:ABC transporter permease [Pirellulales bacterium]
MTLACLLAAAADGGAKEIPLTRLAISFAPVVALLAVQRAWGLGVGKSMIATVRMLLQLLVVGYVLVSIFQAEGPWIVLATLSIMLMAASWIAVRSLDVVAGHRRRGEAFAAIAFSGVVTLVIITQGVLMLEPWHSPREMISLAGMIFANAMNAVSLAGERFASERRGGAGYLAARNIAMNAALIPLNNTMLAVGLVSLPGMMTGQLLAGASPLVAARYQIMVMAMVFGSGGIAAAIYLRLQRESGQRE